MPKRRVVVAKEYRNWCPNSRYGGSVGQHPYFTGTYADYYYIPANHPI